MFKRTLSLILVLTTCLTLAACGNEVKSTSESESTTVIEQATDGAAANEVIGEVADEVASAVIEENTDELADAELADPVLEWWELYNPNGFDTVTCLISNPNDVAIDVSYNLVFYKNGAEVSRIEYCDNFSILPGRKDIIWANVDVPSAADADDVKIEDIFVSEAYDPAIDGTYEYVGITDGNAYFDFTFDSKPTLATIWFLLYNDNNGNNKFDKGEIVVTSMSQLMEQTGRVSFETDVYPYTNYEVYFTAY